MHVFISRIVGKLRAIEAHSVLTKTVKPFERLLMNDARAGNVRPLKSGFVTG